VSERISDERLAEMLAMYDEQAFRGDFVLALRELQERRSASSASSASPPGAQGEKPMPATAYSADMTQAALSAAIWKLREWASECTECKGKGYTYGDDGITGRGPDDRDPTQYHCEDCADIRETIAACKKALQPLQPDVKQEARTREGDEAVVVKAVEDDGWYVMVPRAMAIGLFATRADALKHAKKHNDEMRRLAGVGK
jgi:hypothetical protein